MTAWHGWFCGGAATLMPVHDLHLSITRQPGAAQTASRNSPPAAGRVSRVGEVAMLGTPFPETGMRVAAARWPAADNSPAPETARSAGWPAVAVSRIGSAAAR